MGPEWLHKLIHSLRVLWAFPNARWDPFALERCLQHTAPSTARVAFGLTTDLSSI